MFPSPGVGAFDVVFDWDRWGKKRVKFPYALAGWMATSNQTPCSFGKGRTCIDVEFAEHGLLLVLGTL